MLQSHRTLRINIQVQVMFILYSYFMPVWGIVKTAAPRCHGKLDALLPKGERCIKLSTEPRGSSFVYSAKRP